MSVQPRPSVLSYEDEMDQIFSDAELSDDEYHTTPGGKMSTVRTVTPSLKIHKQASEGETKKIHRKTRTVNDLANLIASDVVHSRKY